MTRQKTRNREKLNGQAVVVYLPTNMKERWQAVAAENRMSMSRFIRSAVSSYLFSVVKENAGIPRERLMARIKELEDENKELKDEMQLLKILSKNLHSELNMLRLQMDGMEHPVRVERNLVYLLKRKGALSTEEIIKLMDIPQSDSNSIRLLMKQLEMMQYHRFLKYDGRRWLWNVP